MSTFRSLCYICCAAVLAGCGQNLLHFQTEDHIGMKLFGDAAHLSEMDPGKIKIAQINKVYAYEAILKEMILERNQITDFGLVNNLSVVPAIDRHATGYTNKLYFFTFDLVPRQHRLAILMSTSFSRENCVGVGPVYIGSISDSDSLPFNVFRAIALLEATYTDSAYVLTKSKRKLDTQLEFFMDRPLLFDASQDQARTAAPFSITRIVQSNDNKISGNDKKVVYDIGLLFNDPSALKFSFFRPFN